MNYKFYSKKFINGSGRLFFRVLFFLSIISQFSFAQSKTNLEIFYTLIDSSVNQIANKAGSSKIILEKSLPDYFSPLNNQLFSSFNKRGKELILKNDPDNNLPRLNFVIEKVAVVYGEMFRDGFLGSYLVSRSISLQGNFLINSQNQEIINFNFQDIDTVAVGEISNLENPAYPFTKGNLPAEPFFSSLLEPIVAIGTTALAVVLFFTVRSK